MSYVKPFVMAASVLHDGAEKRPVFKPPRHGPSAQRVLFQLMCAIMVSVFASCDKSDEPTLTIDYFFTVCATPPSYEPVPKSEKAYTVTKIMKDSIRRVYPKTTIDGNDGEVIAVCDRVYRRFLEENPEAARYFYCEARLNRARMRGSIVASYTTIKRYNF